MARRQHIDNDRLLDAVRAVFLRRGPAATTLEVAKEAGVSEGTLFKRFGSKDKLFREALKPTRAIPDVIDRLPQLAGHGDLKANLVKVGVELIDVFELTMPLMMLGFSQDRENPEQPGPMRAAIFLARFFDAEMQAGRMRRVDPQHAAMVLLGALVNYVMSFVVMPNKKIPALPRETFVTGVVDLLWTGIAPK